MQYKYSYQVNDDFIADILRIDASVYQPAVQGTENSVLARYNANRESFILAYDNSQIIGYAAFFPITNELSERMKNEDKAFDDNIQAKDILPSYTGNNDFDLFLISIAILPEYIGRGIGTELMKKYFAVVSDKIQDGCRIKNTYSYAVTDAGARILSRNGFTEVKDIQHPELKTITKLMRYEFSKP